MPEQPTNGKPETATPHLLNDKLTPREARVLAEARSQPADQPPPKK